MYTGELEKMPSCSVRFQTQRASPACLDEESQGEGEEEKLPGPRLGDREGQDIQMISALGEDGGIEGKQARHRAREEDGERYHDPRLGDQQHIMGSSRRKGTQASVPMWPRKAMTA